MNNEYTLSIIKPDAMDRNLANEINKYFTDNGLTVLVQKEVALTQEVAEKFYAEHKGKPFYDTLVRNITASPVMVQVLTGPNAILKNREIMGATDPKNADPGTIRYKYGLSIDLNSVHGSDSTESAKREIGFFFDYDKITIGDIIN